MPGFCGIYRHGKPIDADFDVQTGLTPTKEKEYISSDVYIRQYIIPKFENDKIFSDSATLFYCTDGLILNNKELYPEYSVDSVSTLLPEMFKRDGISHITRLRGGFSGVIVDKINKTLYLFTEHLGSKRIFYYYNPDNCDFFFASDLKIVTTLMQKYGYDTALSEEGAYCLLTFGFMLKDKTLCEGVQHLEPGTILAISLETGSISKNQYYELKSTPYIDDTEDNIVLEMDKRFCQAIRREYNKDLEYGYHHAVTLSGGLDSRMTLVKGVMEGFKNIRSITFSESGYLDEKIAEKIASDLGCDHVFHSLDNGNYLLNVEDPVKGNDGLILYSGAAHQLSTVSMLNWENFGLLHTGLLGGAAIRTYLHGPDHKKPDINTLHSCSYSKKLLNKFSNDFILELLDSYENEELFIFNERGFNGIYNGYHMTQNYTEFASPGLDIDFLDYAMRIKPKLGHNHYIYKKWITKTTPIAEKYIWEATMSKINTPYFIGFCKRAFRYLKGRILKQRLVSMNPFNYWYAHNPAIKEYFDKKYAEGIDGLSEHETLLTDAEMLYSEGTPNEKMQVLTLLEAIKWLRLS